MKQEPKKLLVANSIEKKIKGVTLFSHLSFNVEEGECFGIVGENGSGKTTLLRILTGLVAPTSGSVNIFDSSPHHEPEIALNRVSAMIGIPAFYAHISAYNNLRLFADSSVSPGSELLMASLEEVGLADERSKKVGAYSRGMLQRLGVALTLLEDRPLIILDEPTQGVDSIWASRLVDIFKSRIKCGKSLIITSHDFDLVMEICTRVLILHDGKSVYLGQLKEVAEFPYYFHLRCSPSEKGVEAIKRLDYVYKVIESNDAMELTLENEHAADLVKTLVEVGCDIHEFALKHYSISDLVSQLQHQHSRE